MLMSGKSDLWLFVEVQCVDVIMAWHPRLGRFIVKSAVTTVASGSDERGLVGLELRITVGSAPSGADAKCLRRDGGESLRQASGT